MFYSLCHDFGGVKEYLLAPCWHIKSKSYWQALWNPQDLFLTPLDLCGSILVSFWHKDMFSDTSRLYVILLQIGVFENVYPGWKHSTQRLCEPMAYVMPLGVISFSFLFLGRVVLPVPIPYWEQGHKPCVDTLQGPPSCILDLQTLNYSILLRHGFVTVSDHHVIQEHFLKKLLGRLSKNCL